MIQLDIPLFDQLQDAIASPQDAELLELLRLFDATMLELDDLTCLRVAGDAIVQLATIFEAKYGEVSKQVEQVKAQVSGTRNEPIVPIDFFDRWVRQSMIINLDQFVEPVAQLPLPFDGEWEMPSAYSWTTATDFYQTDSAQVHQVLDAVIDDVAELLESLPGRTNGTLERTEVDHILDLAHGEEIDAWTVELSSTIERLQKRKRRSISLLDLVCALESQTHASRQNCLIQTWLTFLLGKHPYQLHRKAHDFYSAVGIEVCLEP